MDPIEYIDGQWYFWDETWSHTYGPYETEEEARRQMNGYIENGIGW